jgi:hypothetical protein
MMSLFKPKPHLDEARARIRGWVSELGLDDREAVVMVQELRCEEPGCPPVETVIAVLGRGRGGAPRKIHKATCDVTRDDVAQAFAASDVHGHEHGEETR